MLTVEDALKAVLNRARPLPPRQVPLAEALGCVLAQDVTADIDSPPFDKALVDGYAVRATDLAGSLPHSLRLGEEIPAGRTPTRPLGLGEAALVMTGAPLPAGSDAVVMVEHSRSEGGSVVLTPPGPVRAGQNRMERGREMRAGEVVLREGNELNPVRLGLLAAVGCSYPWVRAKPFVRIVSTGDEVVPHDELPGPGQIRNSNAVLLAGMIERGGIARAEVGPIAPDDPERLREALDAGLRADVLLVTGGVSAGRRDLVPATLTELGVETVFHKIRLKPGKPLLFGVGQARHGGLPGALVFALPGNPVSVLVGFLLFVRKALHALRGFDLDTCFEPCERLALAESYTHRGDRPTYHPAQLRTNPSGEACLVRPLPWAGSPDLRTVAYADGFAVFPPGDREHPRGEFVEFLPL